MLLLLGCRPRRLKRVASRSATTIYQAAIARFRVEGFAATKVDDVIADAGVSWGTFFRYFPRKGDVLSEAAARHFAITCGRRPRPRSRTIG